MTSKEHVQTMSQFYTIPVCTEIVETCQYM